MNVNRCSHGWTPRHSPVFLSPAFAKVDPAGKNKISTSLSRLLIYPSVCTDDELSVRLLDASSPISSSDSDPNDDRNACCPRDAPPSLGGNAGDASTESPPLSGGWRSPIDLAMHDMTSSRRSKSSWASFSVGRSSGCGCGVGAAIVPILLTVREIVLGVSVKLPVEVRRSPA